MHKAVTIIIVNWNGRHHLARCLPSVLAQSYSNYEVLVVDNGSTDDSADFVIHNFPMARLIQLRDNLGFAAGNNIGIRATNSEYIVLLNNDTEVEPDWLAELIRVAESDVQIGSCASKMLLYDHREVIDSAGITIDRAGIGWNLQRGMRDDAAEIVPREVFGACAGAALYRRDMLDDVGLFDEDYFMYYEDVDLAWRARWAGWKCMYVPTARVYHVHSATGGTSSTFKNYHIGRNKIWTIVKNYPLAQFLWFAPIICLYDLGAILYGLFRADLSLLRGRLAALRDLPFDKRRDIVRRVSYAELSPLLAPLRLLL